MLDWVNKHKLMQPFDICIVNVYLLAEAQTGPVSFQGHRVRDVGLGAQRQGEQNVNGKYHHI